MPNIWKLLHSAFNKYRTALIINVITIIPFFLLTVYIKVSTILNGYSSGRTLRRSAGIELLTTLFSEPYTIPYEGILTEVSEIVWCFPIALCLFTASLLQRHQLRQYLICVGIFLGLLLLDDAFRITLILHFLLDMPKGIMYGAYGIGAGAIALYFWRTIITTPYRLLLLASGLLIISAAADFLPISGIGTPIMLEDGTKLLGLVNLTLYIWRLTQQALTTDALQR